MSAAGVKNVLVIGAGSGIGQALITRLTADAELERLWIVGRHPPEIEDSRVRCLPCSGSMTDIDAAAAALRTQLDANPGTRIAITHVFICLGTLHGHLPSGQKFGPEKQLEALDADAFHHVMQVNAWLPLRWLVALRPIVASDTPCRITVFSARVGSVEDNRSGGWYSYRMSKAALNMGVKTAAIEYQRRAANVKLILFQPGTTNTPLSRPFQRHVAADQLHEPEFVAERLLEIVTQHQPDGEVAFVDWRNEQIPW